MKNDLPKNAANSNEKIPAVKVLIIRDGRYLVAQCLEYDIAVQATDIEELKLRFTHVMHTQFYLDRKYGIVPFSSVGPAPETYWKQWDLACRINNLANNDQESIDRTLFALA